MTGNIYYKSSLILLLLISTAMLIPHFTSVSTSATALPISSSGSSNDSAADLQVSSYPILVLHLLEWKPLWEEEWLLKQRTTRRLGPIIATTHHLPPRHNHNCIFSLFFI
ncbi:hypothetical protein F511_06683 [Dorcoceras hygrometricum]|uniref:Uncharacterized protein n=1 Tax=Dorcoceras hygrometricum TaxID=472368 RepID=A0A2Z7DEJ8_9LAMI|nr:hypothetical protein F511_06683 [Dorcoceras hygrometricum]